jgi:hypothetical protein
VLNMTGKHSLRREMNLDSLTQGPGADHDEGDSQSVESCRVDSSGGRH